MYWRLVVWLVVAVMVILTNACDKYKIFVDTPLRDRSRNSLNLIDYKQDFFKLGSKSNCLQIYRDYEYYKISYLYSYNKHLKIIKYHEKIFRNYNV